MMRRSGSSLIFRRLAVAIGLVMIGRTSFGQVDESSVYKVVLDEAKSSHLKQSIFEGRTTLLVTSRMNWYDSDRRGSPSWTYNGQHPSHLLGDLIGAGVIDSTCSLSEASEGGCQESLERLLISVTGLDTSQEGRCRCEVLVRAPYDRADLGMGATGRRGYHILIEYVVEGQGANTRIIEKNVIIIT